MSKYYRVIEKSIGAGAMAEYNFNVPPNEMLEDITAIELTGTGIDNTRFELQIDDIHFFRPHISLGNVGKTQHEAIKIEVKKATQLEVKGKIYNDYGATITVRVNFGIRIP